MTNHSSKRNHKLTMLSFKFKGFLFFSSIIHFLMWNTVAAAAAREGTNIGAAGPTPVSPVLIGAVLDLNSSMGTMADICMSMALLDFYEHSDYQTRLFLHTKDAEHQLDVASEVLDLLKNEDVHGIIGPETLSDDAFIAELGKKAQVPVISVSARSHSFSAQKNPYLVRTTPDDSNQMKALAAMCKGFEWHEVVILYGDTESGNQFTSKLNKVFREVDIQLAATVSISTTAKDHHIQKELEKLKTMQTRVFLVHMDSVLGIRLFLLAKQVGMMSEGYAWLITDSLGSFLNSMDSTVLDSMEGVLGIRPHVPESKNLNSFKERWKKNMILRKPKSRVMELNVYGLWAYDTVWALAMAVEKIGPMNSSIMKSNNGKNGNDISNLRISQFGPKLLNELQNTRFEGLSGEFKLIDGQLKPSALDIFNVIGTGDRAVGYWTPEGGITRKLASTGGKTYSTSTKELKHIIWPGDSVTKPKGWAIPISGKLKVGVPKKAGFTEFVDVTIDPLANRSKVTGFSIDIFLHALQLLPFQVEHEFIPFMNEDESPKGTYSHLLHNISDKTFDIVVGDATILSDRATYVDFTLPYSESGVTMVVKNNQEKDMWIFTKPFKRDLWLIILATCIFIGIVLRILERRANSNSDSMRPHRQQLGVLFWFPIAILAFPERNMVANKWSRFVMVLWLFMSYILMQSYTANLSAMFTVDQLDFAFSEEYNIGYQEGSFVRDYLVSHLHFKESKLKKYSTIEQYHDAMSKGSKNGGIDAIFDEIPYMKLLLNRYHSKYKMVGPTYRTDGFAFAFPLGSPLAVHFSRAILAVTEGTNMSIIEQKNFGPRYSSENQMGALNDQNPGLSTYNFGGLFIIIASAMLFSVFCSETSFGRRATAITAHYCYKCFSCLPFIGNEFRSNSTVCPDASLGSSTQQEIQLSEQMYTNDSEPEQDINHQSGQGNLNALGRHDDEANFSRRSSDSDEIQESEPRNDNVSSR